MKHSTNFRMVLLCCFLTGLFSAEAQNRKSEYNQIGWFAYNGTFKVSEKFGVHTEYQWRRDNYVENWQQGLLRLGVNYNVNEKLQLRAGYAWAETYPYGETPLNSLGRDFTEHRIFQMATLQDKISIVNVSHRFMLEQRWVGRYTTPEATTEDEYLFTNRARYMLRLQVPLKGNSVGNKTPYVVVYDELFIGFGENVGENVFDQNRIGILLGYRFNKNIALEGGYLNQIVQLGREVDDRNVFQHNNGFILSTVLNFDLRKEVSSGN